MKKIKKLLLASLGGLLFWGFGRDKSKGGSPPQLSVTPAPAEMAFDASGTKSYTCRVRTNQKEWRVRSDRERCVATPDYANDRFTVSARENMALTASETATVRVTAGQATPVVLTATQQGARYVVCVAGEYALGSGRNYACYRRNGELCKLGGPERNRSAGCISLAVSDGTVHLLGNYYDGDSEVMEYWVEGASVERETRPGDDYIRSFAVWDGSVYFGGTTCRYGLGKACYWKDDDPTTYLADCKTGSAAEAIECSGGKVYLAGEYYTRERYACYREDGRFAALGKPEDGFSSQARAIALSEGRVCVAGVADGLAALWIDARKQSLEVPHHAVRAEAGALCASDDGKVYIAGFYTDGRGRNTACWWTETGRRTDLGRAFKMGGIAVAGETIYVSGHYRAKEGDGPCYRRDGERFELSLPDHTEWFDVRNIRVLKE